MTRRRYLDVDPDALRRLGEFVEARIRELQLGYNDVARRADMSDQALRYIRKGTRHRPKVSTLRDLSRALGLAPDTLHNIVVEGSTPTAPPAPQERVVVHGTSDNPIETYLMGVRRKAETDLPPERRQTIDDLVALIEKMFNEDRYKEEPAESEEPEEASTDSHPTEQ